MVSDRDLKDIDREGLREIEAILRSDPGDRGVAALGPPNGLERAVRSLIAAHSVALVTGFYVPSAAACETDGPPGALALFEMFEKLGIPACFLLDANAQALFQKAGVENTVAYAPTDPSLPYSHLIAIERSGRASDGRYYSMTGTDLTRWTEPIDDLFLLEEQDRPFTIGIGDGGNEIGMGAIHAEVVKAIPIGAKIASVVSTDALVVAGMSNWGAWGLIAACSLFARQCLLPTRSEATRHLLCFVESGAVDGISGRHEATVDGLDLEDYLGPLDKLRDVVERSVPR